MPLDPDAQQALAFLNQMMAAPIESMNIEQLRAAMGTGGGAGPDPIPVARVETFEIAGPAGPLIVRLYADCDEPAPTLLFFHGGGFVLGSLDTHDALARELVHRSGWSLLSVDYRLAPENPYPAALDDCYAALVWATGVEAGAKGIDGKRLAVGGDSAGGNLAAAVALAARERAGPGIAHQLLIYPVIDHDFDTPSFHENAEGYLLTRSATMFYWDQYLGPGGDRTDPLAAPGRAGDLAGLPPATVITVEYDPLRDEGESYATRLKAAGVPTEMIRYPGVFHGFVSMPMVQRSKDALNYMAGRLKAAA